MGGLRRARAEQALTWAKGHPRHVQPVMSVQSVPRAAGAGLKTSGDSCGAGAAATAPTRRRPSVAYFMIKSERKEGEGREEGERRECEGERGGDAEFDSDRVGLYTPGQRQSPTMGLRRTGMMRQRCRLRWGMRARRGLRLHRAVHGIEG